MVPVIKIHSNRAGWAPGAVVNMPIFKPVRLNECIGIKSSPEKVVQPNSISMRTNIKVGIQIITVDKTRLPSDYRPASGILRTPKTCGVYGSLGGIVEIFQRNTGRTASAVVTMDITEINSRIITQVPTRSCSIPDRCGRQMSGCKLMKIPPHQICSNSMFSTGRTFIDKFPGMNGCGISPTGLQVSPPLLLQPTASSHRTISRSIKVSTIGGSSVQSVPAKTG